VTAAQEEAVRHAQERATEAQLQCWPDRTPELVPRMVRAALTEIAYPNQCPSCRGHKEVTRDQLVVVCETCDGVGVVAVSDRARAASLGRDESRYRRGWRPCYEYLLAKMRDQEAAAARDLTVALTKRIAQPD
jgi:hypothetical protein